MCYITVTRYVLHYCNTVGYVDLVALRADPDPGPYLPSVL